MRRGYLWIPGTWNT
ncbi:hypothetical protein [uncultured Acidaminococcus sp.]